jgi:hypothetical protein
MVNCSSNATGERVTAEIAIINKTAIALAADSKMTFQSGFGKQKTYDTVDKIFSLSKTEPVGAMIYGGAEFMGFPWETILKEYRRTNPKKSFNTIFDWSDDLLAFLKTFFAFTVEDDKYLAFAVGTTTINRIYERFIEFLPPEMSPPEIEAGLGAEFDLHIANAETENDFLTGQQWNAMLPNLQVTIDQMVTSGFAQQMPGLQNRLRRLVELSVCKQLSSPAHSGLVIAGFGDSELLPSMMAFEIDGLISGQLKHREIMKFDGTRQNRGLIQPFAQSDMVHRFMDGIDPDHAMQLNESMKNMLAQNIRDSAIALGHTDDELAQFKPAFDAAIKDSLTAFWQTDKRQRWERFSQPIIDMTMSLPKDELAHMAEALVSLTSLQRRVSREIETVGGAVDVAVISKGDGFIWVKRKHYFDADRNLRFVRGYFSEYDNPKSDGE